MNMIIKSILLFGVFTSLFAQNTFQADSIEKWIRNGQKDHARKILLVLYEENDEDPEKNCAVICYYSQKFYSLRKYIAKMQRTYGTRMTQIKRISANFQLSINFMKDINTFSAKLSILFHSLKCLLIK